MTLSIVGCGVTYVVKSFNKEYDGWFKSICQGKQRIKKMLKLKEKHLKQPIPVNPTTNTNVMNHQVSIGSTISPQILKGMQKVTYHPNIYT